MPGIDLDTLALGAAVVATILAAVGALPQLRRVLRTGDVRGVSFSMVTLNAASELGWCTHFAGRGQWAAVPASFLIVGAFGALGVALRHAGADARRPIAVGGCWALALLATRWAGGPAALAGMLSVTKVVQVTPQVWMAWRTREPTGVSSAMWMVAVVEATLWAAYGAVHADIALVSLGVVGLAAGTAVLVRTATIPRSGCRSVPADVGTSPSPARIRDGLGRLDRAA